MGFWLIKAVADGDHPSHDQAEKKTQEGWVASHRSEKLGRLVEADKRAQDENWVVWPGFDHWTVVRCKGVGGLPARTPMVARSLGLAQHISRGTDTSPQVEHSSWGLMGTLRFGNDKHLL